VLGSVGEPGIVGCCGSVPRWRLEVTEESAGVARFCFWLGAGAHKVDAIAEPWKKATSWAPLKQKHSIRLSQRGRRQASFTPSSCRGATTMTPVPARRQGKRAGTPATSPRPPGLGVRRHLRGHKHNAAPRSTGKGSTHKPRARLRRRRPSCCRRAARPVGLPLEMEDVLFRLSRKAS